MKMPCPKNAWYEVLIRYASANATLWRCKWKSISCGVDAPYENANLNFMHVMQVFMIVASINSLRSWILIATSHESFFFWFWWDFKCLMQNSCSKNNLFHFNFKDLEFQWSLSRTFFDHVQLGISKWDEWFGLARPSFSLNNSKLDRKVVMVYRFWLMSSLIIRHCGKNLFLRNSSKLNAPLNLWIWHSDTYQDYQVIGSRVWKEIWE